MNSYLEFAVVFCVVIIDLTYCWAPWYNALWQWAQPYFWKILFASKYYYFCYGFHCHHLQPAHGMKVWAKVWDTFAKEAKDWLISLNKKSIQLWLCCCHWRINIYTIDLFSGNRLMIMRDIYHHVIDLILMLPRSLSLNIQSWSWPSCS